MTEKHVNSFELNGVQFRGRFLTPEKALDVFAILSPIVGVALEQLTPADFETEEAGLGILVKAIHAAISGFKDLPKVAPYFYAAYQVRVGEGWRDLAIADERSSAFAGKASLHIAWVIAAVQREFADFLDSSGSNTLRDLAKVLGLQIQPRTIGLSGD